MSVAARDRGFAKAIRRIRPKYESLCEQFERLELESPIHEAILLGLTDDKAADDFVEVENRDGFFQIIAGCPWPATDEQLSKAVFERILKAVVNCPFTIRDRERFEKLVREWGSSYGIS